MVKEWLDTTEYDELTQTKHTLLRGWWREIDGKKHFVAWMKYEGINIHDEPYEGEDLFCECSFKYEIRERKNANGDTQKYAVGTGDSHGCPAKRVVQEELKQEARDKYLAGWRKMGVKRAVYNIFRRVQRGEYLGQAYPSIIYVQEVAKLLEKDVRLVWKACAELFAEEKMDLSGAILAPYIKRFRFPKEIQSLFAYIIEEPLGWPNGDAGDGFVYELEKAIHENTRYKHGKDAFWEENYPNLSYHHLIDFGFKWLYAGIMRYAELEEKPEYMTKIYFRTFVKELEKLVELIHELKTPE